MIAFVRDCTLILDDQGNHLDSFTISLESFRSFRGPLFQKPGTFFCCFLQQTGSSDIIAFLNRLWWVQYSEYFYFRCKSWQNNPKNNRDGNHLHLRSKYDWVSDQREGSSWWCHHNWQSDWKNNKIEPIFYTSNRSVQIRMLCRILNFTLNVLILAFNGTLKMNVLRITNPFIP